MRAIYTSPDTEDSPPKTLLTGQTSLSLQTRGQWFHSQYPHLASTPARPELDELLMTSHDPTRRGLTLNIGQLGRLGTMFKGIIKPLRNCVCVCVRERYKMFLSVKENSLFDGSLDRGWNRALAHWKIITLTRFFYYIFLTTLKFKCNRSQQFDNTVVHIKSCSYSAKV